MEQVNALFCLRPAKKQAILHDMKTYYLFKYENLNHLYHSIVRFKKEGVIAFNTPEAGAFLKEMKIESIDLKDFGFKMEIDMDDEINKMLLFVKDHQPRTCNCGLLRWTPKKFLSA